jgi:hypothetical protein
MDTPTAISSVEGYLQVFGYPQASVPYGAQAVAAVAQNSDGIVFTRVGKKYKAIATDGTSSHTFSSGSHPVVDTMIFTTKVKSFSIGDYLRVTCPGNITSTNAIVTGYITDGGVLTTLPSTADLVGLVLSSSAPLSNEYVENAQIDRSTLPNAASNAESFLESLVYGANDYTSSAGFVSGNKGEYEFTVSGVVGPQPVVSMSISGTVGTIILDDTVVTLVFQVNDRIHIDNTNSTVINNEFTVATVATNTPTSGQTTLTVTVPGSLGSDILNGKSLASGYVQVTVAPGSLYHWTKSANETMLINGSQALTSTGDFTAQGTYVRVYSSIEMTAQGNLKIYNNVPSGSVSVAAGATAITIAILAPGDLIQIAQTGFGTTREAMVQEIVGGSTVNLYPSNNNEIGYVALALQDTYVAGQLYKVNRDSAGSFVTTPCMHIVASSAGTWANSDGVSTGLWTKVAPGSTPGTKKFMTYLNGSLVETIDNLSTDPASLSYYPAMINGISDYIAIFTLASDDVNSPSGMLSNTVSGTLGYNTFTPPANTMNGWGIGVQVVNFAVFGDTNRGYGLGFDGENAEPADYIGTYDTATDTYTGLQAFLMQGKNLGLAAIAVPGVTDFGVQQEMFSIAEAIFAEALIDPPLGLNGRAIVDWTNGTGVAGIGRGKLDTWHGAMLWSWAQIVDPFTGLNVWVPPSIALMRQQAYTATHFAPWYAAAGETRGVLSPWAIAIEFPHLSMPTKQAMYGGGQVVNPILAEYGEILIYGNCTLLRVPPGETDKLTDLAVAMLTKYMVRQLDLLGRKYIFDPNDPELMTLVTNDYSSFLDVLKDSRALADYALKMDASNNTAEVQNANAAVVNLNFIPFGTMERLYVNATVNASGATINSISSSPVTS